MDLFLRNVLRNAVKNKTAYLGAVCIIALGILIYVAMTDTLHNLQDKVDIYYEECQFADVFATVGAMPASELAQLEAIPGVETAFGRLSGDARLLLDGQNNIVTLHLLAYSADDILNKISLSDQKNQIDSDMIYLGSKMLTAYHFPIGQELPLLINGDIHHFTLGGQANAPEYIYAMPPNGAQTPDGEIYDIACIDLAQLESLLNRDGQVTELGFLLQEGYGFDDIKAQLESQLSPYGLSSLTAQKDQSSTYMLRSEFSQLSTMGTVLPAIFLAISIFMLYIVLKKIIDQDRSLIGTLKAFGFTDLAIIAAYLKQGAVIGLLGAVLGSLLAIPFGQFMFDMYIDYFNLPYPYYDNYVSTRLFGIVLACAASLLATYWGICDILSITPAEAMRPAVPQQTAELPLPQILRQTLNTRQKMGLRTIWRHKSRSVIIALAIAFPFALCSVLFSFDSVVDQMFYDQFNEIQLYDLKVSLSSYTPYETAVSAATRLDYVYDVEAIAEFPLLLHHDNLSQFTTLTVLPAQSSLYKIKDIHDVFYTPQPDGLIINSKTASDLHVQAGDTVELTSSYLSPVPLKLPILTVIEETLGTSCYLSQEGLMLQFGIAPTANAIIFNIYPSQIEPLKTILQDSRYVTAVTDSDRILKNYQELMQSMIAMVNMFSLMAVLTGIILIYNISLISIRERRLELGTLSILGTQLKELSEMILFEQLINFVLGILLGIPLVIVFKQVMEKLVASDTYTIALQIPTNAYAKSFIICLALMIAAFAAIMKNISRIEPADILKERE